MADLFENPMGLCGFEFVEFAAPERGVIEPVFQTMGFTHVANHRSKDIELWRQGDINFLGTYTESVMIVELVLDLLTQFNTGIDKV